MRGLLLNEHPYTTFIARGKAHTAIVPADASDKRRARTWIAEAWSSINNTAKALGLTLGGHFKSG